MRWLNPLDPRVRSAVVSGLWGKTPHSPHHAPVPTDPDEIDVIADVLEQASDVLSSLTAGTVHPALQVTEDFVCYPTVSRLSPSLGPLRQVQALWLINDVGTPTTELADYLPFGDSVRFVSEDKLPASWMSGAFLDLQQVHLIRLGCACPAVQRLRLTYDAGSTVTARARAMVLTLAHEFYLQVAPCDECGACRLPLRTTNVQREGIAYSMADPYAPGVAPGATGLPEVDLWVQQVNPYRVGSPSRVYTADAPPSVVRSLVSAREQFPTVPAAHVVGTTATVVARGVVA